MMSSARSATWEDIDINDIFPDALSADRAYLVNRDESCQPCVFYFRKSVGDDFATQILRCLQYARQANLRLDTTVGNQGVYFDDDKSASKDIERPGYDKLMSDVISGNFDWAIRNRARSGQAKP
ncbi:MAG: hypothetical protein GEV28_27165 [Actinophytocola sp.]|nr:hypothetical protein [Actinophytocola sp.]